MLVGTPGVYGQPICACATWKHLKYLLNRKSSREVDGKRTSYPPQGGCSPTKLREADPKRTITFLMLITAADDRRNLAPLP
ncbi:hypothetical protein TNCV_4412451 [Trichonephila clavipes]|nr:hypothetical protein TNCV_4412451 [Trichonephila clavipes]